MREADIGCGAMLALLIDGLNLVRRIEAAVPGDAGASAHADGVLESCTRSVRRALAETSPTHALCVFDAPGKSWRHEILASYKSERPPMPEALAALMPRVERAIRDTGPRPVRVVGFEADDVIATIAEKIASRSGESVILSTDKSLLALLRPGIRIRDHFRERELDDAYVRERFGVGPAELPTWLALVGDRSQGVPGVRSVGAKTATRLVAEHGDMEAILAAGADIPGRLGEALRWGADDARLSLQLNTLRTDVEVGLNLNECRLA